MCQLSETSEWWTSLSTSYDKWIMTAIARSRARASCNAKVCELTGGKFEAGEYFRAHKYAMMTERADAFSGPGCVCTLNCLDKNQLAELTSSLISVDPSAFAHESCIEGAIRARGGVLKSTLVVDNDRQCTMYTRTQSPSVPQS